MRAGEVMTRNVVTVRPDAMIREAAQMMDDLNVGALPVCDGRRLVGMITDQVCWCFEDDSVDKIEDAMARRQIRRMPVVDQAKRLVGMVTLGDLATDRAPGAGEALRRISEPSEPDRSGRSSRQGDGDAPWPAYGDG